MATDGFITKEEWIEKGRDLEQWRDEDEFKRRGEEILPILNANNKKLQEQVKELKGDMQKIVEFNEAQAKKHEEDGYQRALKEIQKRKKEAIKDEDFSALEQADREKDELVAEYHKKTEQKKEQPPGVDIEFEEFKADNDWYEKDLDLTYWANTAGTALFNATVNAGKSRKDAFKLVANEVKARFSDKFENLNRDKKPSVEGDVGARNKTGGKNWSNLPGSAKKQFKRIQEQMKLKGREYKKEDYLANYDFEETT